MEYANASWDICMCNAGERAASSPAMCYRTGKQPQIDRQEDLCHRSTFRNELIPFITIIRTKMHVARSLWCVPLQRQMLPTATISPQQQGLINVKSISRMKSHQ